MNGLDAFLNPIMPEEKEIMISNRFVENGKAVAFKIRPISQEENDELVKKSTHITYSKGKREKSLDSAEYSRRLIVAATTYPDFTNSALCERYGVLDPLLVPGKMLLSGEYASLLSAISELSGFSEDLEGDVKN